MKKIFLVALLTPLLMGCPGDDLDIIENERLYAEGFVTLENGTPVVNTDVSISENSGILGQDVTDASGAFSFVSLKSSDEIMTLSINKETDTTVSKLNYLAFNTAANNFSIGEAVLKPIGFLNVSLTKNTPEAPTLFYTFVYEDTFCDIQLTNILPDDVTLRCYESVNFSGELGPNGKTTFTTQIESLQETPVKFIYQIGETGEETIVEIPLNNTTNSYEFEY